MLKIAFVAGVALLVLVGCGEGGSAKTEDSAEMKEIKLQRLVRSFVEPALKDPRSAEFRNQYGICGEVNAKNSFGGYTGFKRFIAGSKDLVLIEGAGGLSSADFNELWSGRCNSSPTGAPRPGV